MPGKNLPPKIEDYIPSKDDCSNYVSDYRSPPYSLSSPAFEDLHPEEAAWVDARLDLIAPIIQVIMLIINCGLSLQEGRRDFFCCSKNPCISLLK